MSASEELSESEIDRRFNHWSENDGVDHCKHCGSFIPTPEVVNKRIQYVCSACNRAVLEYVG